MIEGNLRRKLVSERGTGIVWLTTTGVWNDVGLIGVTGVETSIMRVMENTRKAVMIRTVVGKTQNLDLLLPPVVNDTPLKESYVITEDALATLYKQKNQTFDVVRDCMSLRRDKTAKIYQEELKLLDDQGNLLPRNIIRDEDA